MIEFIAVKGRPTKVPNENSVYFIKLVKNSAYVRQYVKTIIIFDCLKRTISSFKFKFNQIFFLIFITKLLTTYFDSTI